MKLLQKEEYIKGILEGNTIVLSRAITLLESTKRAHNELARDVIETLLPHTGKSFRLGITGVPGVGKSTSIESLGEQILPENKKIAVLAIDPSSQLSKGSILGDKTRMEKLSSHPNVYIRPTASSGALGGVGRKTRETILLCEAAGFDYVIVETVGVGQSEIAVHSMVDCFLLLLLPGAGDELQGIKRGIMEMADLICINKGYSEKELKGSAKRAMQEIRNALHYFPQKQHSWLTKVLAMDALTGMNVSELKKALASFESHQVLKGYDKQRRKKQDLYWFQETINQIVLNRFYQKESIQERINEMKEQIERGEVSSFRAAEEILKLEE